MVDLVFEFELLKLILGLGRFLNDISLFITLENLKLESVVLDILSIALFFDIKFKLLATFFSSCLGCFLLLVDFFLKVVFLNWKLVLYPELFLVADERKDENHV